MKARIRQLLEQGFERNGFPQRGYRIARREKLTLDESVITPEIRFGSLVTKQRINVKYWECLCDCGVTKIALGIKLVGGYLDRCDACQNEACASAWRGGTKRKDQNLLKEFAAYVNAKSRCEYEHNISWANYGGRGIKFKFPSFDAFFTHIGPRSFKTSLDRINNDGHYEEGNVRWATRAEQMQNTRVNKLKPKDVIFIRKAGAAGILTHVLASWFKVDPSTIRAIKSKQAWSNV